MEDAVLADLAEDVDLAFADLVDSQARFVYSVALRLTGSAEDADDLTQDVFVRAYRALHGYEPNRIRGLRTRPWLATIAANRWRNLVRDGGRRPRVVPLHPELDPAAAQDGPEDMAVSATRRRELAALLLALPEAQRLAVVLRYVAGLGYGEIAKAVDRPLGTVKSDATRGLARLRRAMEQEAVTG